MTGDYVSLIRVCAETGDLSPLHPLSVKDLIWVETAIRIKKENEWEYEKIEHENINSVIQTFLLTLSDIRTIDLDSNFLIKCCLYKDSTNGLRKVKMFDTKYLPSRIAEAEKEEKEFQERISKLPPKERIDELTKRLKSGHKYKVR